MAHRIELAIFEVTADLVHRLGFLDLVFEEVVVGLADLLRVGLLNLLHDVQRVVELVALHIIYQLLVH